MRRCFGLNLENEGWYQMALHDSFLNLYLETGEIIEAIDLTEEIKGIFMRAKGETLPLINYPYRLICVNRQKGKIVFTVNLEISVFGTCCLGANSKDCHYYLGSADKDMSYEDFKEKAKEIALKLAENKALY